MPTVDTPFGEMASPDEPSTKDPFGIDIVQPTDAAPSTAQFKALQEENAALKQTVQELQTTIRVILGLR